MYSFQIDSARICPEPEVAPGSLLGPYLRKIVPQKVPRCMPEGPILHMVSSRPDQDPTQTPFLLLFKLQKWTGGTKIFQNFENF